MTSITNPRRLHLLPVADNEICWRATQLPRFHGWSEVSRMMKEVSPMNLVIRCHPPFGTHRELAAAWRHVGVATSSHNRPSVASTSRPKPISKRWRPVSKQARA